MADGIEKYLGDILAARYGEEVRQSIHDAIHQCYEDGRAGATDLVAREQIANLVANAGAEGKDSELVDIRVGADGMTYESAGEAVRGQTFYPETPVVDAESNFDADAASPNKCYTIDVSAVYGKYADIHIPESRGLLITFNSRIIDNNAYMTQLFSALGGKLYYRTCIGSGWRAWSILNSPLSFGETSVINQDSVFNANNAEPNKCYTIDVQAIPNKHLEIGIPAPRGLLITFNSRIIESNVYMMQLFADITNIKIYWRVNRGSWSAWECLSKRKAVTLSSAQEIYNAFKSGESNIVYNIEPGTYDLYTGLIENDILSDNPYETFFGNNITINGCNSTITCIVPTEVVTSHSTACLYTSPINVRENIEINDLTIEAQNIRYCIHDESNVLEQCYYTKHIFNNLKLICKYTYNIFTRCIGIGGSKGQKYIFNNVYFNYQDGVAYSAFYLHGRGYNIGSIEFNGCVFEGNNTINLSQYTGNNIQIPVKITNTKVSALTLSNQDGYTTPYQYVLTIINSGNPILNKEEGIEYIEEPKIINL